MCSFNINIFYLYIYCVRYCKHLTATNITTGNFCFLPLGYPFKLFIYAGFKHCITK
nr:MAG TPA: hypothetical protein [Caudoviricetes sp.]